MNTKTEICNRALGTHLGADTINNYDSDTSVNAIKCRASYPTALNLLLESHPWQFAKRSCPLNLLTDETPLEWEYAYAWPSGCVMPREIYRSERSSIPISYDVMSNEAGDGRIICTNEPTAYLIYTKLITNVSVMPYYFKAALAISLALDLADQINASAKKKEALKREAYGDPAHPNQPGLISEAKSKDTRTRSDNTEPACEFLEAMK